MKVAVWTGESLGPAAVFIPRSDRPADVAQVPGCPPGPARQWAAKGSDTTWRRWAEHLADGIPHGGQWSVQDVPDGADARYALRHLREQAQAQGLTQVNTPGSVEAPAQPKEGTT